MTAPRVYMLTWCGDVASLYGSLLTLQTLRVGFPTAQVVVMDNASVPAARGPISVAAHLAGAQFLQRDRRIRHAHWLEEVITNHHAGPCVVVDPDVCFWKSVEGWDFGDALLSGRLIPAFRCEYTKTITHARLHSSFLWAQDAAALRAAIATERAAHFEWNPILPSMLRISGEWHRLEAGSSLYSALPDRMHAFGEAELDAYDHLFVGSHLGEVVPALATSEAAELRALHAKVKAGDIASLRGVWRSQQAFFERRAA